MRNILMTKEVADMLRVSEEYVRELIRKRKLKAYQEGRRGGYRVTIKEIQKYVKIKHQEFERKVKGVKL